MYNVSLYKVLNFSCQNEILHFREVPAKIIDDLDFFFTSISIISPTSVTFFELTYAQKKQ